MAVLKAIEGSLITSDKRHLTDSIIARHSWLPTFVFVIMNGLLKPWKKSVPSPPFSTAVPVLRPNTDPHWVHFDACICGLFLNRGGKSHHKFSLSSFVGVIQNAGRKRSSQGPLGGKLNAAQIDPSRPSSTQSVSTQFGKLIMWPVWCQ